MWSSFTTILWCLSMPKLCTLMKLFWGRIISVELIITSKEDKAQIHLNYLYRVIQNKNWRRKWQPIPVFLTREFHGQKSLVGCHLWAQEESDMTERLHFHFSFSCIGEGNGSPLQCSCLENPRDRGAQWAAVYGVSQSQTSLKGLSTPKITASYCWSSSVTLFDFQKIYLTISCSIGTKTFSL